jgi:hypothetical protein
MRNRRRFGAKKKKSIPTNCEKSFSLTNSVLKVFVDAVATQMEQHSSLHQRLTDNTCLIISTMDSQTPKCGSLLRRKAVRTGKYW